jgi:hypothetical protein
MGTCWVSWEKKEKSEGQFKKWNACYEQALLFFEMPHLRKGLNLET